MDFCYQELNQLAAERRARLEESRRLWKFFWEMAEEVSSVILSRFVGNVGRLFSILTGRRSVVSQEGWIREKEQILSSEDHGKDLTGAVRLLSQHKAFEDEMSGRAAHLQQTIKQGEELVANNHFGADKIKERIQDIQVRRSGPEHVHI